VKTETIPTRDGHLVVEVLSATIGTRSRHTVSERDAIRAALSIHEGVERFAEHIEFVSVDEARRVVFAGQAMAAWRVHS
jgi:hypothetical protein